MSHLREAIRSADAAEFDRGDYTGYREVAEILVEMLQEAGDDAILAIDLPDENRTEATNIMRRVRFEARESLDNKKEFHGLVQRVDPEDSSKGFTVFFSFRSLPF